MNLELVKTIDKAKTNAVEVAFWIKSKKYVKKLSIETIEAIMKDIQNPKVQFITFADSEDLKTINKADIVDITIDKKDYLIFKNAARAEEKEKAKKEKSIGENDDKTLNLFRFIKIANQFEYYMRPEKLDIAVENIFEIKIMISNLLGYLELNKVKHSPEDIKKLKENLDKYMEILEERKRWNEALLFAALSFEEVAAKALKENIDERDQR